MFDKLKRLFKKDKENDLEDERYILIRKKFSSNNLIYEKIFYILIHVNGLLDRILLETKGRFAWKQGGE
ncbi:hypothetical protein ABH955_001449 [Bacillus sp. RC240]|uniref:hypothetical protein n=1 Tax=unclassified Bacillus (in: firmicutes) TaxID=185979 RepID=UPI00383729A5